MHEKLPNSRAAVGVHPGNVAPDFEIRGGGSAHRLSDFRGTPVVLALHSPHWDPASDEVVEAYNRLIASLPGLAGARLVSIRGAGIWRALSFDADHMMIPVVAQTAQTAADAYGLAGKPAVFVIDSGGVVRWRHTIASGTLPSADQIIAALAPPAPPATESSSATSAAPPPRMAWTRRQFVATALGAAFALVLESLRAPSALAAQAQPSTLDGIPGAPVPVALRVNGRTLSLTLEPRVTLLDALREYAGLTGTKKGCDHGQCGACTVHVNDRRVLSCLTLAVMAQGKEVTTIEGLAPASNDDRLHPMQQAFITHDGFQCGYCTSGQLMSATAMVREPWGPGDDDVREAMSGNICRCGAYPGIVAAIQEIRRGQGQ